MADTDTRALIRSVVAHVKAHGAYDTIQAVMVALSADGSRVKINWRAAPKAKKTEVRRG